MCPRTRNVPDTTKKKETKGTKNVGTRFVPN